MTMDTDFGLEGHHHRAMVIYTRRWLRKLFWVECWGCTLRIGPYRRDAAHTMRKYFSVGLDNPFVVARTPGCAP